jgi:alpha-beta hydrolase superfamily lysophospholipase
MTLRHQLATLLLALAMTEFVEAAQTGTASGATDVRTTTIVGPDGRPAVEERGRIALSATPKRYVLRYPKAPADWNGRLLVGAHGGTGGERFDADGRPIGTDETALDDVVGEYALGKGYIYASFDRDGTGATRDGLTLTYQFTRLMRDRVNALFGQSPERTYLAGLSMGGGIARYAAEDEVRLFDGVLIVVGAAGDVPTRLERQAMLAALWPVVDPRLPSPLPDSDPRVQAYAEAIGTPVAARAYWPFTAASATVTALRASLEQYGLTGLTDEQVRGFRLQDHRANRPFVERVARQDTTGRPKVPTIEVAGTHDDLVIKEVMAYRRKFELAAASAPELARLHRLYLVEGAWHISGDDDASGSFQFVAKRMKAGEGTIGAIAGAPSYLPTVRESLDYLDRWISKKEPPPANRTVRAARPGAK